MLKTLNIALYLYLSSHSKLLKPGRSLWITPYSELMERTYTAWLPCNQRTIST